MWINLSRQQGPTAGGGGVSMAGSSVSNLIPPPGPPTRPDRSKKEEKKRRSQDGGGEWQSNPSDLPVPAGCCGLQEDEVCPPPYPGNRPPLADPFCDGRAGSEAETGENPLPFRRAFKLAGHASDLGNERNMLPMWLEESHGQARQIETTQFHRGEAAVLEGDASFETRWDSLRNKNKVRSSCQVEKRPTGWEDVGHNCGGREKNANVDKSLFCPPFVIKEAPQTGQCTTDGRKLSNVVIESPASPRVWRRNHNIVHEMNEANSLDFREFSERVNHLFPESRLQGQYGSISTTNVAPQSASNSPSKKGVGASSSITDPRLWASSDSFICEDFTFYDRKGRDGQNKDFLPPPRSYSQVLYGGRQDELRDHLDATDNLSDQLPDNFTQDDRFGGLSPELSLALSNDSLDMECFKVGSDVMVDDQADMADVFYVANHPSASMTSRVDDENEFRAIPGDCEASVLQVTENVQREHWIKFDAGSTEHLAVSSKCPSNFSSTNSFPSQNFDEDNFGVAQTSVSSTTSPPPSTDDHHASIVNLMDPSVVRAPEPYRGRFIRTYSQRGRRVSKNVLNSVSRRINATDYGKLTEPVPPRYSRAALTMNSGPGLFEEVPSEAVNVRDTGNTERSLQGRNEDARGIEVPLRTLTTSPPDNVATRTFLEPDLPQRVGSVRVPRLSSTLVRRSVSLSIPKVEREVPFQRLPDRRQGSFRRAISGLGALARSFKRKPVSEPVTEAVSQTCENGAPLPSKNGAPLPGQDTVPSGENGAPLPGQDTVPSGENGAPLPSENGTPLPGAGVRRTGSFALTTSKQTPRAPRLPRRAISHRIVTPTYHTGDESPKF
ncbi:uncharacterized protein [Panulirus ornatus]|uniref:uncharacterized protein isoform X2 n=1 Tax=Panulirus ornatus TaxID=150431 RepID=UPI003A882BD6